MSDVPGGSPRVPSRLLAQLGRLVLISGGRSGFGFFLFGRVCLGSSRSLDCQDNQANRNRCSVERIDLGSRVTKVTRAPRVACDRSLVSELMGCRRNRPRFLPAQRTRLIVRTSRSRRGQSSLTASCSSPREVSARRTVSHSRLFRQGRSWHPEILARGAVGRASCAVWPA